MSGPASRGSSMALKASHFSAAGWPSTVSAACCIALHCAVLPRLLDRDSHPAHRTHPTFPQLVDLQSHATCTANRSAECFDSCMPCLWMQRLAELGNRRTPILQVEAKRASSEQACKMLRESQALSSSSFFPCAFRCGAGSTCTRIASISCDTTATSRSCT